MTPARRFAFRLALALGYLNPDAMLARMPYRIWSEWQAFAALEPFGEERADLRAGIVAATVANCMARGKGRRSFKPRDFMPRFEETQRKPATSSEHYQQVLAITQLFGGKIVRVQAELVD